MCFCGGRKGEEMEAVDASKVCNLRAKCDDPIFQKVNNDVSERKNVLIM